jgi:hypothetical protein
VVNLLQNIILHQVSKELVKIEVIKKELIYNLFAKKSDTAELLDSFLNIQNLMAIIERSHLITTIFVD